MDTHTMEDMNRIIVMASAVTTVAIDAAKISKKRRNRNAQAYIHRNSIPLSLPIHAAPIGNSYIHVGLLQTLFNKLTLIDVHFCEVIIPPFEAMRETVNFESPYCRGPKKSGRKSYVNTLNILSLVFRYIKPTGRQQELWGMFGMEPRTLPFWIEYEHKVLLKRLTFIQAEVYKN